MLVDLARGAGRVIRLQCILPLCDLEVAARDYDVGGVCRACPLLAVGAVAEGMGCGFT